MFQHEAPKLELFTVTVPIPCRFYHYCSVVQLEVKDGDSPRNSFIFENSFCYPEVFFLIQMNLRIAPSISVKNWVGIFRGVALNLYIAFGRMAIFTTLTLPVHKHGRFLHFLRSSISFSRDLKLLSYRSFTCLVRVTPRHFILFVAIVTGIASQISFLAYLSFV